MPNLSVGDWVSLHSLRNEIATACVKPRNDELKIATGHGPRNDELKIATGHGPRNDGVYKRHPEELKTFLVIPRSGATWGSTAEKLQWTKEDCHGLCQASQ